MKPVNVGVIGCGNISNTYFQCCKNFEILNVIACADMILSRAQAKAKEFGIPKACTTKKLIADPNIDVILNLTIPAAHGDIGLAALEAGKCVYNEKPFAPTREEGARMLALARKKRLAIGGAPDTFLGAGLQTCRKLVDDGWIGTPIAATAFMLCHGHENWHPDPCFFYQPGGGPLFDMGPYYLTALINLLGPVCRVAASTAISFPERLITSEPKRGAGIKVNTPTHIAGVLDFASGAVGTMIMSFDVWSHQLPIIEVYGSEGSLVVPDPNGFGGVIRLRRKSAETWSEIPHSHPHATQNRGIGLADLAYAHRTGRLARAAGEMAFHVLDVMHAFLESSREGRHIDIASTCKRPKPLPLGMAEYDVSG